MTKRSAPLESALRAAAVLAAALVLLAGCGKSDAKKAATQVAAKVNADEISVHQINDVLARTPGVAQDMADKARREILNRLVDQQLAMQQAVEKKLDRAPEVMTAVEAARREILARAYLEQLVKSLPKPTDDESRKYYAAHPELFAGRRIYRLEEIALASAEAPVAQLRDMLAAHKSMEEIAATLKQRNVRFVANSGSRPAEQIPLELLAKLYELKDGQSAVIETPQAAFVVRVLASQAAPVDEATALPRIHQFLANQQGGDFARREMAQLREKAKIEYLGEFTPSAEAKPAAPAPAAQTNMDKGVAGLK